MRLRALRLDAPSVLSSSRACAHRERACSSRAQRFTLGAQQNFALGNGICDEIPRSARGRKLNGRATAVSIVPRALRVLWADGLSIPTVAPGVSAGTKICRTDARNAFACIAPGRTLGAVILARLRAPRKGMLFQCPCGIIARPRSSQADRPRTRDIWVLQPV